MTAVLLLIAAAAFTTAFFAAGIAAVLDCLGLLERDE